MRSLILIEVEHGETTDDIHDLTCWLESDAFTNWSGLKVNDWSVKVDLPECFVLEGGQSKPVDYSAGMTDTELAQELIDMGAFGAWLDDTSTLADFYNKVMTEAANA